MSYEEFLKTHICPDCHCGILFQHPELHAWVKCPICGFSQEIKDERPKK